MNDNPPKVVDIKILDRVYKIKCTSQEARELQVSAKYLEEQMKKVHQSNPTPNMDRVAIVTALNISQELLQLKREQTQLLQQLNGRLQNLRDRIKNFLEVKEEIAV